MYYIYRFPLGLLLLLLLLLFKWKFLTFVMWKSYIEETISHLIFVFFFKVIISHIYIFLCGNRLFKRRFLTWFYFFIFGNYLFMKWFLTYLFIYLFCKSRLLKRRFISHFFVKIISSRDDLSFLKFFWNCLFKRRFLI